MIMLDADAALVRHQVSREQLFFLCVCVCVCVCVCRFYMYVYINILFNEGKVFSEYVYM